jgi:hypothetical protein
LLEQGKEPVLIDARSATAQMLDPAVPGALLFNGGEPSPKSTLDKGRHIIVYCSCPNDVTAAHVAKRWSAKATTAPVRCMAAGCLECRLPHPRHAGRRQHRFRTRVRRLSAALFCARGIDSNCEW